MPRTLALDVGDRRIGLALTDELNLIAQPLFTIHRTNDRADLKSIARFIRKHGVTTLVVGHPLNANGSLSAQSAKARAFAEALRAAHPELEHHLLDERLTTLEAHALLDAAGHAPRSAGKTHGQQIDRKDLIDQVAAVLLLESFLSQQNGPSLLPDPDTSPQPE
jgi:putative Holliday junction resolvase